MERRKQKRHIVKNGVIAAVIRPNPNDNYIYWGEIINISNDGLTFVYTDRNIESKEPSELDIVIFKDIARFTYLKNIPFETVWISNVASNPSPNPSKTKQRGVQFGEMAPRQIALLDNFIQKYALDRIE